VKAVLNLINKCPSAARRDPMIHRAADLLHISPQALGQDLRREQRNQRAAPRRTEEAAPVVVPPKAYPQEEISLLELLVHYYPDVQPLVFIYLPADCLTNPICRELVEMLMVDHPEALTEGFHDFDAETQKVISRVQVEESRTIDAETTPVELAQQYILRFWKPRLEREQLALTKRTDMTNEERFKERTRIQHDLHTLAQGWEHAQPMIEARLHSGD
jgi:hypothetical protein